jgi:hypothetical protein
MAEVEYKGIKVGGSKLLLIIPLIGTIVGGLWGGFEVYQRYLDMEKRISKFVSPDMSGFDKRIALVEEKFEIVDTHMEFVSKEIGLFKEEIGMIKEINDEHYQTIKDLKASMREDISRQEKIIDDVEDEIAELEGDVRDMIDIAEGRFENKRDQLQNDYEQKADTIRTDVERKLAELETRLNKKLQRALDNPLAN